jgi:hypothetical protein
VGHQGDRAGGARAAQSLEGRLHLPEREAQAVHARVDLEVGVDRAAGLVGLQHPQLLVAVDRGREPCRAHQPQLLGIEESLEQENRLVGIALPKGDRALDLQRRKTVRLRQGAPDTLDPVSIAVRLDHGEDLRARGSELGHGIVVAQRLE